MKPKKPKIKIMQSEFLIKDHTETRFWLRIVASNGKTVLDSEVYENKSNAVRAAKRLSRVLGIEVMKEKV